MAPKQEDAIQNHVRAAFSYIGPIWRNNVGVLQNMEGRPIRYGLANDSKRLNQQIKSSDLIGITPVTAYLASTQSWVTLGVFTALEIKESGWVFNPNDKHACAQAKFHEIVRQAGGFAGFVNDPGQINNIILRF